MRGLQSYPVVDNSSAVLPANYGIGRRTVVGSLIHTTSGVNSLAWLVSGAANAGHPASADYLIDRDGKRHKLGKPGRYPYHAGVSRLAYAGVVYANAEISSLLLGWELENADNTFCTWEQLDSLAEGIVLEGIDREWQWPYYFLGHYEVARPLGRRLDPLGFLWGDFMGRLYLRALTLKVPGL